MGEGLRQFESRQEDPENSADAKHADSVLEVTPEWVKDGIARARQEADMIKSAQDVAGETGGKTQRKESVGIFGGLRKKASLIAFSTLLAMGGTGIITSASEAGILDNLGGVMEKRVADPSVWLNL